MRLKLSVTSPLPLLVKERSYQIPNPNSKIIKFVINKLEHWELIWTFLILNLIICACCSIPFHLVF